MRGQPTHLAALVRWFMDEAESAVPVRLHSRDTADDGDPEWHASFRRYILGHPGITDDDGDILSPFRWYLWVLERGGLSGRIRAEFLYRLAMLEGDWLTAARTFTPLTEEGEVLVRPFAVETLQMFWRMMQTTPRKNVQPSREKSDAQLDAEHGC